MDILKIKEKLSHLFGNNQISSNNYPIVFYGRHNNIYFLYKNNFDKIFRLISKDGFNFNYEKALSLEEMHEYQNLIERKDFIVDDYLHHGQYVKYLGDRSLKIGYSLDGKVWTEKDLTAITSSHPLEVAGVFVRESGIILFYFEKTTSNKIEKYKLFVAFFDKNNPEKLSWKLEKPIWEKDDYWPNNTISPLGITYLNNLFHIYWKIDNKFIFNTILSGFKYSPDDISKTKLNKHFDNPLISPNMDNHWEAFNTFNPAAVKINDDIHVLYRAQGFDYVSSVGYAKLKDGLYVDKKLDYPVYNPTCDFEVNKTGEVNTALVSGGGYGGCEDPRLTQMGDEIYMTYVAFDGCNPPRLALTHISVSDFLDERWNWSKPVLISPPGIIDKSGCLLSEKINDKYVFFHRVFPNILIDYVDDLNFDGNSQFLTKNGHQQIKIRENMWDSRKIGVGAPPLKTKDGWLLIYYGVDDRNDSQYHIGAMLLDLNDPSKVLHRSNKPILSPSETYENEGFKPGIAYPCGAVIMHDQLLVYYGGADSYVCLASSDLNQFLEDLKNHEEAYVYNIKVKEVNF